jgi:multidrug resistance efflux pump
MFANYLHAFCAVRPTARNMHRAPIRIIPLLITLATTGCAMVLGWAMWNAYMGGPWTRDSTVRTYVVIKASDAYGRHGFGTLWVCPKAA